ncbi:MAG: GNAT family N-acetyltransferase [Pirellulales bacterium]|nr:GNAT family N-acetyltransferase [Pirellulales bacterium]
MDDARIAPSAAGRAAEVLELAFSHLEPSIRAQQVQTLLNEPSLGPGLIEARRGEDLVGAICCHLQPGGGALAWPPRLVAGESKQTAGRLLEAVDALAQRSGVTMINVLMEMLDPGDEALLTAAGYERMAELLYLVCGEDEFPREEPAGQLIFEPYTETQRTRMAEVVEATYEGTLDCPGLNDARSLDDVLEGYRHTGEFAPERWRFVRHDSYDVGCLIVSDHPEHTSCELIYMGLTARARGHGWGKEIARYAQWLTARAGRPRLVLAVDGANRPAIDMYSAVGFHQWDQRIAYVKLFRPDRS